MSFQGPISAPHLPALDGKTAAIVAIGATLVQIPATSTFSRMAGIQPFSVGATPVETLLIYLIGPGIASLLWIWFFGIWRESGGWQRVGLGPPLGGWLGPALWTGIGALALAYVVSRIMQPLIGQPEGLPLNLLPGDEGTGFVYSMLFFVGIAGTAPLLEEIIYRGIFYGWLRRRAHWLLAAVLTATIHAYIHFDPAAIPTLAVVFVLFTILYEKTGTLWAPITAHAVYNLLNIIAYVIVPTIL